MIVTVIAFVTALLGAALGATVAATLAYFFLRASNIRDFARLMDKQADVGQTLADLKRRIDHVQRQLDADGRSRLVVPTAEGRA